MINYERSHLQYPQLLGAVEAAEQRAGMFLEQVWHMCEYLECLVVVIAKRK